MTEQECIDAENQYLRELNRVSTVLMETPGNTLEAYALRDEYHRLEVRLKEAHAKTAALKASVRARLVHLLNLRTEALWNPCDECGEHVDPWEGWLCEDCEDAFFTGEDEQWI